MGAFLGTGLQNLFTTLFEIWTYMATAVAAGVTTFIWGWVKGRGQGKEEGRRLAEWREAKRREAARRAQEDAERRYGDPHVDPTGLLHLRTPRPRNMPRAPFSGTVYPVTGDDQYPISDEELDDPRGERGHRHQHRHRE